MTLFLKPDRLMRAIIVARDEHGGVDKSGQPFIGHPLRVMARMNTESEMVVAVLHDVFEARLAGAGGATPWAYTRHPNGYSMLSEDEATALDALTRIPKEPYFAYIHRVCAVPLAARVKLADLADNLDPRRPLVAPSLRERYREAVETLTWAGEARPS